MRRLFLDFKRSPGSGSITGWSVLVIGLATAALTLHAFLDASHQVDDLEYRLARLERKPTAVVRGPISDRDTRQYAEDIKYADTVALRLTRPWSELFQALEESGSEAVALLTIEPDPEKGGVRLTAETKDKAAMLAYIGRLSANSRLGLAYLLDHQVQLQEPGQPVRFTVLAHWKATP